MDYEIDAVRGFEGDDRSLHALQLGHVTLAS